MAISTSLGNGRTRREIKAILFEHLIGSSPPLASIRSRIAKIAHFDLPVLITGETGVGKEPVARSIHATSRRASLLTMNCAALSETLAESELFGHEKGSFTGATGRLIGKIERANRGTLFLDEVGELPLQHQVKLLRVLDGHPFERVGGSEPITTDVRLIAATNRDLQLEVEHERFRRDLFHRLNVIRIHIPPLRDRKEDVAELAQYFLEQANTRFGTRRRFAPCAIHALASYFWPGNVRELRHTIDRTVVLADRNEIRGVDINFEEWPPVGAPNQQTAGEVCQLISLKEAERRQIRATLAHTGNNQSQAAIILGIHPNTLRRKAIGYGLLPG